MLHVNNLSRILLYCQKDFQKGSKAFQVLEIVSTNVILTENWTTAYNVLMQPSLHERECSNRQNTKTSVHESLKPLREKQRKLHFFPMIVFEMKLVITSPL